MSSSRSSFLPQDSPDQAAIASLLAEARRHLAEGDRRAALAELDALLRLAPHHPPALVERGRVLRELGRFAAAERDYQAALAEQPRLLPALLGLGRCAAARGDLAAALERFTAAAEADPASPWPRLEAGAALRGLGRPEAAEAAYRAALERDPGLAPALLGLGLLARERGDRLAARSWFEAVLARQPLHHLARVELATECCALGEHDRAQALLGEVLRAAPGHLQALLALGETERRAGAPQAALAAFEAAARHHPALPRPLVEMAREWRRLGRPEEADRLLRRALALAPECRPALLALAESALEAGQEERALALYRQVIAAAADSLEAHLGAAEALQALGRIGEAMALLEEAEARLGASPGLVARRVALLHLVGRWPEALALARQAAAAAPWHFGLWLERFQVELRLGEPEEVAACLEAAPATSAEQRARVEECRGRAAERAWRLEAARAHHEEALRHAPALAAAHDGLVRIGLLRLDLAAARHHLRASAARRRPAARGGLARAMETLPGQVLEDALLDEPAVARLRALRDLSPAARIARQCDIVREHPDSTAAALCLLLSLREAGLLDPPAPAGGPCSIPRRIGQYWDEPEPPAEVAALMRSWPEANPHHAVQVFDHAAAQAYLAAHHPPAVLCAYLRARHPAMRADILRLAWLAREGGVWADADDRCLAPLETLPLAGARFLAYQEPLASLGNNLLGAAPNEPVIRLALALAVEAVNRGDQDSIWLATGPGLLSRAFARTLVAWEGTPEAWLRGRVVLPAARLFRAVAIGCHAPYRRTERHWLHPGAGRVARAC